MSLSLNILKLFSSKIAIQVLAFVTVPVITRLFLPEHFGILQIFDSISKMLIVIVCLKYDLAIPLARDDKEAAEAVVLSLVITLIFTFFVIGIVTIGRVYFANRFKIPEFQLFLWLLPLTVFASSITNIFVSWATRKERFGTIAWSELGPFSFERLILILWGVFLGASLSGLFFAYCAGLSLRVGLLFAMLRQKLIIDLKKVQFRFGTLWMLAKRYKKLPMFITWSAFLITFSDQLPPLFLSAFYSKQVVGYYSLGNKVINLPMRMLRISIAKVFFPVAAQEYHETGALTNIVSTIFMRTIQIAVFPMITVSMFGPILFEFVFGHQWYQAGVYAQLIAVWGFFAFISAPIRAFLITNRQEFALLMNIITLISTGVGLLIGGMFASPFITLGIFVAFNVCCQIATITWKLKLSKVSILWALNILVQYVVISYILLLPLKLLSWLTTDLKFIMRVLFFTPGAYVLVLLKLDQSYRQFLRSTLRRLGIKMKLT